MEPTPIERWAVVALSPYWRQLEQAYIAKRMAWCEFIGNPIVKRPTERPAPGTIERSDGDDG